MPNDVCSEQAPQQVQEVVQEVQHSLQEVSQAPQIPQEVPQAPQAPHEVFQVPAIPVYAFSPAAKQTASVALPGRVRPPRRVTRQPIKKATISETPTDKDGGFTEEEIQAIKEVDDSIPQFAPIPQAIVSATSGYRLDDGQVPVEVPVAVEEAPAESSPAPGRSHRLPVRLQKKLDRKTALLVSASAGVANASPAAPAAPAPAQVVVPRPSTAPANQFTVEMAGGEQEQLDYGDESDAEWCQKELDSMHAAETAAAPATPAAPAKLYDMNSEMAAKSRAEFDKTSMQAIARDRDVQAEKPDEAKEVKRASSEVMAGRKTLKGRRCHQ